MRRYNQTEHWVCNNWLGLGVAIVVAAAFALTRVMSSLLFGVSATDPVIFASISSILTGVALGATFIPAGPATQGRSDDRVEV